ncbi:MAG TPA: ABC transporter permease [Anaerolineaceae bacterium]|nr:ABC transporter permease [Anaerolineaceae bacterium]HPN52911.1 ABC transporter permease [Anaerolineaceae bacterium]
MSEATLPKKKGFQLPIAVRIEPRISETPFWLSPLLSLVAVLIALFIGGILLSLAGADPILSYQHIFKASFGDWYVFSDTLQKATPILLVTLACILAFRMRIWNIGAEGQFFLGAWGASLIVLLPVLPEDSPSWLFYLVMALSGMFFGALWGFVPGFLKAKFQVNEIITTLMMNYIAISWNNYFIFSVWSEGGFQMTRMFPKNAWLPRLGDFAAQIPFFRGMTTHMGLLVGIVAAVVIWYILFRSPWGYEIRLIGDNPKAAKYAGISITRNTVLVMMLSGALAGLAGMSEISGTVHRLQGAISPGYGFTGVIVAWLAKLNPFAAILASILFGALILAGREIQPSGIPKMIQGVILVCLIASDFFMRYNIRIERRKEA